jgi:hypothetical protein
MKVPAVLCYENNNGNIAKGKTEEEELKRERDATQSSEVNRSEIGYDKSFKF